MIELKNKLYIGSENRTSTYDISIPDQPKALIIFAHGYKGYKDWGAWGLVQDFFVSKSYGFIKFNFSHNGGTADDPIDFPDLEAFGRNDYSKELFDLKKMTALSTKVLAELNIKVPIYLIGHSRGGGMAILHALNDDRIDKIVSWAGVSDLESRFPVDDELEDWKSLGVRFVKNGRTNQMMPHLYSMYENFELNHADLNIQFACEKLKQPFLQIHGDMDLAVSVSEGLNIAKWTDTSLSIVKGAEHTFGTKHPWELDHLPEDMIVVVNKTFDFFETT